MGYYIGKENSNSLAHYGIKKMRWGVRRYQNEDGTLTAAGKARYSQKDSLRDRFNMVEAEHKKEKDKVNQQAKERNYAGGAVFDEDGNLTPEYAKDMFDAILVQFKDSEITDTVANGQEMMGKQYGSKARQQLEAIAKDAQIAQKKINSLPKVFRDGIIRAKEERLKARNAWG